HSSSVLQLLAQRIAFKAYAHSLIPARQVGVSYHIWLWEKVPGHPVRLCGPGNAETRRHRSKLTAAYASPFQPPSSLVRPQLFARCSRLHSSLPTFAGEAVIGIQS